MSASVFTKEDINLIKESWASLEASVRLRCESEEELKSLYFAYKAQFGNDQRFLDALSKRKQELQAA